MEPVKLEETTQGKQLTLSPNDFEAFKNMKHEKKVETLLKILQDKQYVDVDIYMENSFSKIILFRPWTEADLL